MAWNHTSELSSDAQARGYAKAMRRDVTEAEKKLWWVLRHDLPPGTGRFRRQAPIGRYIVDFVSLEARLVVEVDGEQHGLEAGLDHDRLRTEFLEAQGFRVMRFWNRQVLIETRSVIDAIFAALQQDGTTPTPYPSPQGGGERQAWRRNGESG